MDDLKPGDLVFLTSAYDDYIHKRTPDLKISMVNRLAKLEEIIDWGSEKGKIIKAARQKSGKWDNLPLEDNKWVFSVFHHELTGRKNQPGVIARGVCIFSADPATGDKFFQKIPDWIYKEISKKCFTFGVSLKDNVS